MAAFKKPGFERKPGFSWVAGGNSWIGNSWED